MGSVHPPVPLKFKKSFNQENYTNKNKKIECIFLSTVDLNELKFKVQTTHLCDTQVGRLHICKSFFPLSNATKEFLMWWSGFSHHIQPDEFQWDLMKVKSNLSKRNLKILSNTFRKFQERLMKSQRDWFSRTVSVHHFSVLHFFVLCKCLSEDCVFPIPSSFRVASGRLRSAVGPAAMAHCTVRVSFPDTVWKDSIWGNLFSVTAHSSISNADWQIKAAAPVPQDVFSYTFIMIPLLNHEPPV